MTPIVDNVSTPNVQIIPSSNKVWGESDIKPDSMTLEKVRIDAIDA